MVVVAMMINNVSKLTLNGGNVVTSWNTSIYISDVGLNVRKCLIVHITAFFGGLFASHFSNQ